MRLPVLMTLFVSLAACAVAAPAPERRFTADEVRADFSELYARAAQSHFDIYARRPKADYDAQFRTMLAGFDRPMTAFEVRVAFQKFLAFGRVAHSRIDFPSEVFAAYRDAGGRTMPVFITLRRGRAFVAQNGSGLSIKPADEIVALNGMPMAAWRTRLGVNISADNDYMLDTLLENRFAALLWLERGPVDAFKLTLRDQGGAVRDVTVPTRTREDIRASLAQEPPALELDWDKREFRIVGNVGYLRPGPFYNNDPNAPNMWDPTTFKTFIDASFEKVLAARARALVIDIRDNPGGDNSFSDHMVAWFATKPFRFARDFRIRASEAAIASNAKRVALAPNDKESISAKFAAAYARHRVGDVFSFDIPIAEPRPGGRFTGKVYLLINRHSYSNTVQVAALAQDYGFATILGEETSDLATTFGAMEQFTLTRTGIDVGFPKAQIIRVSGDERPRGVVPDIAIDTPIPEPKSDPVLQTALDIASKR